MKKDSSLLPILLVVILAVCCCSILILGGGYYGILKLEKALPTFSMNPFPLPNAPTSTPFELTRLPAGQTPLETLKLLEKTTVPGVDLAELACRFKNVCNVPPTLALPAQALDVGAKQDFWVNSEAMNSYFQIHGILRYVTPHVYFWIEDGISFNEQDLRNLVEAFENKIYPTDRQFFGSEWTPGVDDDPHIYIVYARNLGATVGGYFSNADEYNPLVRQYSNAHEMFFINASQPLNSDATYGALAHEFQHVIEWYQDRNETAFLNEGFSKLAEFINGYPSGDEERYFITNPDINLTDWIAGTAGDNIPHYGASFLFVDYFLSRFGENTTKAFVHDQQNGLAKIDHTLAQENITDPSTGKVITADDFFLDWAITNYLQDGSVGDGRYTYHNFPQAPKASPTETISSCPEDAASRTVNQYGTDYIQITCPGSYTLHFDGATSTRLVPADPHTGSYAYWSNKGDESDMTLTHEFDLTKVSGSVSMNYWTWFDIEKDYDYVYVEASVDGQHWTILTTPSGTSDNPYGASYGWAYSGLSNGWIQESVDLTQFAGQKVTVRFEYLTDEAVNGEGFLLDDITVPAINYSTGFETDDASWQASGFARIENGVPQTYRLALITYTNNGTTAKIIPMSADQSADIPLTIGQNGIKNVVLVVTGTTRFTRVVAPYQFTIR